MITHFQAVMGGGRRPYLAHSYDLIGMQWPELPTESAKAIKYHFGRAEPLARWQLH
jgi:hypothetical protein